VGVRDTNVVSNGDGSTLRTNSSVSTKTDALLRLAGKGPFRAKDLDVAGDAARRQ